LIASLEQVQFPVLVEHCKLFPTSTNSCRWCLHKNSKAYLSIRFTSNTIKLLINALSTYIKIVNKNACEWMLYILAIQNSFLCFFIEFLCLFDWTLSLPINSITARHFLLYLQVLPWFWKVYGVWIIHYLQFKHA